MPYCDPEAQRVYNEKWRRRNKDRLAFYRRLWTYGVSEEQWAGMTKNGCGICGSPDKLRVDHDHKTGKVRGALCSKHNVGLGQFDDDPELLRKAIEWLERKI